MAEKSKIKIDEVRKIFMEADFKQLPEIIKKTYESQDQDVDEINDEEWRYRKEYKIFNFSYPFNMDKSAVAAYFNHLASEWDNGLEKDETLLALILDNAEVKEGSSVLDVACGTGVMIPYYLERRVSEVTGVDISSEMINIAEGKFQDLSDRVSFVCGDAETYDFGRTFDNILIYNAFPHFPDPDGIIRRLAGLLNNGGTLTVAHGMSRNKLDAHHSGSAREVSVKLLPEDELADIFSRYLQLTCVISDDRMYQVCGKKNI